MYTAAVRLAAASCLSVFLPDKSEKMAVLAHRFYFGTVFARE